MIMYLISFFQLAKGHFYYYNKKQKVAIFQKNGGDGDKITIHFMHSEPEPVFKAEHDQRRDFKFSKEEKEALKDVILDCWPDLESEHHTPDFAFNFVQQEVSKHAWAIRQLSSIEYVNFALKCYSNLQINKIIAEIRKLLISILMILL